MQKARKISQGNSYYCNTIPNLILIIYTRRVTDNILAGNRNSSSLASLYIIPIDNISDYISLYKE